MRRRTGLFVLSAAVGMLSALVGPVAAEPAGTITLPTHASTVEPHRIFFFTAGTGGLAYVDITANKVVWLGAGDTTASSRALLPNSGGDVDLIGIAGSSLVYEDSDPSGTVEDVHVDLSTGVVSTDPALVQTATSRQGVLGATTDGWLIWTGHCQDAGCTTFDSATLSDRPVGGGADTPLGSTLAGTVSASEVFRLAQDANGIAYLSSTNAYYHPFGPTASDVQIGSLSTPLTGFLPGLGVSPSTVVWQDPNGTVHIHPRASGADTATFSTAVSSWLAATDSAVLVAGSNGSSVVWDGATAHSVPGTLAGAASDGSQLYGAVSSAPSLSSGIYPVTSTGTFGARVLPIPTGGPARTSWVGVTAGRVAYRDDRTASNSVFQRRDHDDPGVDLTVSGTETRVAASTIVAASGQSGFDPAVSGDRTVAVVRTSTGRGVRELIGTTTHRTIAISTSAQPVLRLSGPRLLIRTAAGATGAKLIDLVHGTSTKVFGNASVWGPYLVWATSDGRIWRRDLTKPLSTNPKQVWLASCGDCVRRTLVWGTWVGWTDGEFINVKNVATGTTRSVVGQDPALTEGALAYFDGNHGLWAMQLSDGAATELADPCGSPTFAADERLIVWVAACGGAVNVARVPFEVTIGPRLLYQPVNTTFTPNHDGKNDTWKPEWDVTKPLYSYTLRIRNSAGHVVRTFKGSAAYGVIRLVWNGKSSTGSLVKGGTYTWTLTGSAVDGTGSIRSASGTRTTVTGKVVKR